MFGIIKPYDAAAPDMTSRSQSSRQQARKSPCRLLSSRPFQSQSSRQQANCIAICHVIIGQALSLRTVNRVPVRSKLAAFTHLTATMESSIPVSTGGSNAFHQHSIGTIIQEGLPVESDWLVQPHESRSQPSRTLQNHRPTPCATAGNNYYYHHPDYSNWWNNLRSLRNHRPAPTPSQPLSFRPQANSFTRSRAKDLQSSSPRSLSGSSSTSMSPLRP